MALSILLNRPIIDLFLASGVEISKIVSYTWAHKQNANETFGLEASDRVEINLELTFLGWCPAPRDADPFFLPAV